jgi:regulator of protease activity HflC (stomatin/prohibitin superfamily)
MQVKAAAETARIRAEAEKAKAEAEALAKAQAAKKADETNKNDEAAAVAARKARRNGQTAVNVSSVLSQPPAESARKPASGFTRSSRK